MTWIGDWVLRVLKFRNQWKTCISLAISIPDAKNAESLSRYIFRTLDSQKIQACTKGGKNLYEIFSLVNTKGNDLFSYKKGQIRLFFCISYFWVLINIWSDILRVFFGLTLCQTKTLFCISPMKMAKKLEIWNERKNSEREMTCWDLRSLKQKKWNWPASWPHFSAAVGRNSWFGDRSVRDTVFTFPRNDGERTEQLSGQWKMFE